MYKLNWECRFTVLLPRLLLLHLHSVRDLSIRTIFIWTWSVSQLSATATLKCKLS